MNTPTWMKVTTEARKFGVALIGVIATLTAQGLIPEPYDKWAAVLVALGTALGVYTAENTTTEEN